MPITTPKQVFVALLSDLRQTRNESQKIYEKLGRLPKTLRSKRLWTHASSSPLKS